MDKEIEKLMKDVLKKMDKKLNDMEDIEKMTNKAIDEHINKPCEISIKKGENGEAECKVEGTRTAILITLAGLEKNILEQLKPPAGLYERIKSKVGIREV